MSKPDLWHDVSPVNTQVIQFTLALYIRRYIQATKTKALIRPNGRAGWCIWQKMGFTQYNYRANSSSQSTT